MLFLPESYTYPMTIHLDRLGVFLYLPTGQRDTQIWLDYNTEGAYHQKATLLNSLKWFELNPFERILENTDTFLAAHERTIERFGGEAFGQIQYLNLLFEANGPEATLRYFLNLCQELGDSISFFDLDDAVWQDCNFLPDAVDLPLAV